jgi:hypothetical protein
MTLLEHLCHKCSVFGRTKKKTIQAKGGGVAHLGELSIGVEISEEQYNRLLRGDQESMQVISSMGATQNHCMLELLPPPRRDTLRIDAEEFAV